MIKMTFKPNHYGITGNSNVATLRTFSNVFPMEM